MCFLGAMLGGLLAVGDSQNSLNATVFGSTKPTEKNLLQMSDSPFSLVFVLQLLLCSLFLPPPSDTTWYIYVHGRVNVCFSRTAII